DEDGLPQTALTRFQYNVDGALLAKLMPGRLPGTPYGMLVQQRFGREEFEALSTGVVPTAEQRRTFGNRLKVVLRESPSWPPADVRVTGPNDIVQAFEYQNPYQQITSETDPRDQTLVTQYHYDPIATKASPAPIPAALTRIEHPATTAPDGSMGTAAIEQFA